VNSGTKVELFESGGGGEEGTMVEIGSTAEAWAGSVGEIETGWAAV
jgi:hypothetical protein